MLELPLAPLDTSTLHERAYHHLREALVMGYFRPGEAVTLRGVAEALGTSIMPVREAVRRLVSEGALETPTSRSIRVPPLSLEGFEDLCHAREVVEGDAAALAAKRCSPAALAEIRRLNEAFKERLGQGDIRLMLQANQALHFAVYAAAESPILLRLIESLWLRSGPNFNLLISSLEEPGARLMEFGSQEHDSLIEAIETSDAERARRALQSDIRRSAKVYVSEIRRAFKQESGRRRPSR